MRKLLIGVVIVILLLGLGAFLLRDTTIEISFGQDWPEIIQGVGEGIETIHAAPDGSISEGDRARATERARWKAYYNAQLRLGEQLGGLKLNATTTIKDTELADRELKAVYAETINAAAEIPDKSSVEDLGDAIRARVVVEATAPQVRTFREKVEALLKNGKITIRKESPPTSTVQIAQHAIQEESEEEHTAQRVAVMPEQNTSRGSGGFFSALFHHESKPAIDTPPARAEEPGAMTTNENRIEEKPEPRHESMRHEPKKEHDRPSGKKAAHHGAAPKKQHSHTGTIIRLLGNGGFVNAAPDFYDGNGTFLGTGLDLPAKQRSEGLILVSSQDEEIISNYTGKHPMEFNASVSKGNIIFEHSLAPDDAEVFKKCLHDGHIVLVLQGEE